MQKVPLQLRQPATNWPEKVTKVSLQEVTTNIFKTKCQKLKLDSKQVKKKKSSNYHNYNANCNTAASKLKELML